MNKVARKLLDAEIARHQIERKALLARAEIMALVGKVPTQSEYAIYHCFTFIQGKTPLAYGDWIATLGGTCGNEMDGTVSGGIP